MLESREYTIEEIRQKFLERVWDLIDYWQKEKPGSSRESLEGLAFSILSTIDGCSADMPAFILAPFPHEDDRAYHEEFLENYYPVNDESAIKGNISGGLHELFYNYRPNKIKQTPKSRG